MAIETGKLITRAGVGEVVATDVTMSGGGTAQDYAGFSTRAAFVAWASGKTPAVGTIIDAAGYAYRYIGMGTAITDLAGWVPFGDVYPDHWAQNVTPGTTDMGLAMEKALGYARNVHLAGATYATGRKLAWDSRHLIGKAHVGTGASIVLGLSASISADDAILAPGRSSSITRVQVAYDTLTGSEARHKRVGIDTRGLSSVLQRGAVIDQVRINNCGTAISDYEGGEFSVTYGTLEIGTHSFRAVDISEESRTGSFWTNLYINGGTTYTPNGGFYSTGQSTDGFIGQLNIEQTAYSDFPLYFAGLQGLFIASCHIEGVDCTTDVKGYVGLEGSSVTFGTLAVTNTRMSADNTAVIRLQDAGYKSITDVRSLECSTFSELKILKLHLKGLASPSSSLYPTYPDGRKGVRNCPGFAVIKRLPAYTDRNWKVEVDTYLWAVFPAQADDKQYLEFPECFWSDNFVVRRFGDWGGQVNPAENLLRNGAFDKWTNTSATITTSTDAETANGWKIRQVSGSMTCDRIDQSIGGIGQYSARVTVNTAGTYQGFTQDIPMPMELMDQPLRLTFEFRASVAGQVFEQISASLINPAGSPTTVFRQAIPGGGLRALADTTFKTCSVEFDGPASSGVTLGAGAVVRLNFQFNDAVATFAPTVTFRNVNLSRRDYGQFNRSPYDRLSLTSADLNDTATTVALLPTPTAGRRAYVNNSSVTHAGNTGAIVAGGGANFCPVYADGTNWRIG